MSIMQQGTTRLSSLLTSWEFLGLKESAQKFLRLADIDSRLLVIEEPKTQCTIFLLHLTGFLIGKNDFELRREVNRLLLQLCCVRKRKFNSLMRNSVSSLPA